MPPMGAATMRQRRVPASTDVVVFLCVLCTVVPLANARCSVQNQRVECGEQTCDPESGVCIACTNSSQCYESVMRCVDGACLVGHLSDTFVPETAVCAIVTVLVCAVAVVAGLGGGGILVPMYAALTDMPLLTAVGLSQAAICGQSGLNMVICLQKVLPTETPGELRPLINYQYLAILLPLSFIGTLLGSVLSKIIPDWLRLALLFALLTSVLHRVIRRARQQFKKDKADTVEERTANTTSSSSNRATTAAGSNHHHSSKIGSKQKTTIKPAVESNEELSECTDRVLPSPATSPTTTLPTAPKDGGTQRTTPNLRVATETTFDDSDDPLAAPRVRIPQREIALLVVGFVSLLVCNILRTQWTTCGSNMSMLLYVLPIAILGASAWLGRAMASVTLANIAANYEPSDHLTFQWNRKTTVYFPLLALIAGGAASMLGIGGGLVLSFVLFEAGLAPEEASATSGFATLTIASESALQLVFQGQLVVDYAAMYLIAGVVSTLLGQYVFMRYIRTHGLQFLIIVALAVIVGGSLLTLTSYGLYDMVEMLRRHDGSFLAFGHLCSK